VGKRELGAAVRAARERKGYSNAEITRLADLGSGLLSALEDGRQNWSDRLPQLAEVPGVDLLEWAVIADLLPASVMERRGGVPELPLGDARREVAERVALLTPERAEHVLGIVQALEAEQAKDAMRVAPEEWAAFEQWRASQSG